MRTIPAPVRAYSPKEKRKWKKPTYPLCADCKMPKTASEAGADPQKTIPPSAPENPLVPGQFYEVNLRLAARRSDHAAAGKIRPDDLLSRRRSTHLLPKQAHKKLTVYLDGTVTDSSIRGGRDGERVRLITKYLRKIPC